MSVSAETSRRREADGALLARQQPLALDLERGHARLFLPALGVEAVDLALERLLAREVLGQALLGEPVLAEQPPVAAGEAVEPLDRGEEGGKVRGLEQDAEVPVAPEALQQARARDQQAAALGRGRRRRGALPGHRGEAAREVFARGRDELALARRDLELELEALQLFGERRFLLFALGQARLEGADAALEPGEIGLPVGGGGSGFLGEQPGGDEQRARRGRCARALPERASPPRPRPAARRPAPAPTPSRRRCRGRPGSQTPSTRRRRRAPDPGSSEQWSPLQTSRLSSKTLPVGTPSEDCHETR